MKFIARALGQSITCLALLALSVTGAHAATVTGQLGIAAVVGAGCQVNNSNVSSGQVNFGNLNFGNINTINDTHIDAQTTGSGSGSIVMECSDGTTFTIALGNGLHYTNSTRSMVNGSQAGVFLSYNLYQDATRSQVWDDSSPLSGTANGSAETYHVYGRIPGGQAGISAGNYSDTVQVVISW